MTMTTSAVASSGGFLRSVLDAFLAPTAAFAALHQRRGWARWAWLLMEVVQAMAIWWFVAPMPADWVVTQQLLQMGELSAGERDQVRSQLLALAPHYPLLAVFSAALSTSVVILVLAAAYWLLGLIASPRRLAFVEWLRLVVWTQWPSLLGSLAIVALALFSASERPLALLNFASLNELWLHWPSTHSGYLWASSLNLFLLWSALLAMFGCRCWTGASLPRATLLAVLPYLLVFGLWAAVIWS